MSIESIESMARSFDNELRQLETLSNSSPHLRKYTTRIENDWETTAVMSNYSPYSYQYNNMHIPPEHSFELAAAESERERLYDRLNDLTARVDELETSNKHLETVVTHYKNRNMMLEGKLQAADSSFVRDNCYFEESAMQQEEDTIKMTNMYKLKCTALELKVQELQLLLEHSQKNIHDAALAREQSKTEYNEEVAKRLHAEKQRDAYAAAYRQALQHIEKWS